jgi:hypothetical protein
MIEKKIDQQSAEAMKQLLGGTYRQNLQKVFTKMLTKRATTSELLDGKLAETGRKSVLTMGLGSKIKGLAEYSDNPLRKTALERVMFKN